MKRETKSGKQHVVGSVVLMDIETEILKTTLLKLLDLIKSTVARIVVVYFRYDICSVPVISDAVFRARGG